MGLSSLKHRWQGLAGHHKVAVLMAAAALGVAAATPWLFDDGTVQQSNASLGRSGVARQSRRGSTPADSGGKAAPEGSTRLADPSSGLPPGSPLPLSGQNSGLFDGSALAKPAEGGGEAGSKVPESIAGLDESLLTPGEGGAGMGGRVGLRPANFGNAKGFIAEPRR